MRITLNGQEVEAPEGDLAALLRSQDAPATGCAVAVNGRVVPRAAHAGHPVRPGDVVEVVRAVQGG